MLSSVVGFQQISWGIVLGITNRDTTRLASVVTSRDVRSLAPVVTDRDAQGWLPASGFLIKDLLDQ